MSENSLDIPIDRSQTNFKYFITLALRGKISWETLKFFLEDLTTEFNKCKELNGILLDELKALQEKLLAKCFDKRDMLDLEEAINVSKKVQEVSVNDEDEFIDEGSNNDGSEIISVNHDLPVTKPSTSPRPTISEDEYHVLQNNLMNNVEFEEEPIDDAIMENSEQLEYSNEAIESQYAQYLGFKKNLSDPNPQQEMTQVVEDRKTKYQCKVCHKGYQNLRQFRCHMNKYHPNHEDSSYKVKERINLSKPFPCLICKKGFNSLNQFRAHKNKHHPNQKDSYQTKLELRNKFQCKICLKKFFRLHTLKFHADKNHPDQINNIFTEDELNQLKLPKVKKKKKVFHCTNCNKIFTRKNYFKIHKNHHENMDLECLDCGEVFQKRPDLKSHKKIHVIQPKSFDCEICCKAFSSKLLLKMHNKQIHEEKTYECEICHQMLSTVTLLKYHRRKHFGEKLPKDPQQCKTCSKILSTKPHLKLHERIHSGEKPYECKTCKLKFRRKSSLHVHERTHDIDSIKHKCQFCDKEFAEKHVMQEHYKSHSEDRPYKCTECDKSFSRNWILNRHLTIHK